MNIYKPLYHLKAEILLGEHIWGVRFDTGALAAKDGFRNSRASPRLGATFVSSDGVHFCCTEEGSVAAHGLHRYVFKVIFVLETTKEKRKRICRRAACTFNYNTEY